MIQCYAHLKRQCLLSKLEPTSSSRSLGTWCLLHRCAHVLSSCPAPTFPACVVWHVCADIFSKSPSLSASPVIPLLEGFIQSSWGLTDELLLKISLCFLGDCLASLMEAVYPNWLGIQGSALAQPLLPGSLTWPAHLHWAHISQACVTHLVPVLPYDPSL